MNAVFKQFQQLRTAQVFGALYFHLTKFTIACMMDFTPTFTLPKPQDVLDAVRSTEKDVLRIQGRFEAIKKHRDSNEDRFISSFDDLYTHLLDLCSDLHVDAAVLFHLYKGGSVLDSEVDYTEQVIDQARDVVKSMFAFKQEELKRIQAESESHDGYLKVSEVILSLVSRVKECEAEIRRLKQEAYDSNTDDDSVTETETDSEFDDEEYSDDESNSDGGSNDFCEVEWVHAASAIDKLTIGFEDCTDLTEL